MTDFLLSAKTHGSALAPLSRAQVQAAQADPDIGFLVDAPHPGAPLVITFGFVSWDALNGFDFVGRTRKLERQWGQPINRILVRDTANLWYQHGVAGLGADVDSVAASLRQLIGQIGPASVSTVGQSMGAYAAILFGALLGADKVLAFGPLSYLRSDWARRDGDTRWLAVMDKLDRFAPAQRYDDLPTLLQQLRWPGKLHIVIGSAAEGAADGANLDVLHARRFVAVPGVSVQEYVLAPHAVVQWLIDQRLIDAVLGQHLLPVAVELPSAVVPAEAPNAPDLEPSGQPMTDSWRSWMAENLAQGGTPDSLLPVLVAKGFGVGEAQRELDKAARSPYLAPALRLHQRVAKRDWMLDSRRRLRDLARPIAAIERRHRLSRAEFLTDY